MAAAASRRGRAAPARGAVVSLRCRGASAPLRARSSLFGVRVASALATPRRGAAHIERLRVARVGQSSFGARGEHLRTNDRAASPNRSSRRWRTTTRAGRADIASPPPPARRGRAGPAPRLSSALRVASVLAAARLGPSRCGCRVAWAGQSSFGACGEHLRTNDRAASPSQSSRRWRTTTRVGWAGVAWPPPAARRRAAAGAARVSRPACAAPGRAGGARPWPGRLSAKRGCVMSSSARNGCARRSVPTRSSTRPEP